MKFSCLNLSVNNFYIQEFNYRMCPAKEILGGTIVSHFNNPQKLPEVPENYLF